MDRVADLLLDSVIILIGDKLLSDQVGTHAPYAAVCVKPFAQRLFGAIHAAGRHDACPRTRSKNRFNEIRSANRIAGEYLDDLAAEFLGVAYFRQRPTAGTVSDLAPVTYFGDVGVQQRTDDKFRAIGDVEIGRGAC